MNVEFIVKLLTYEHLLTSPNKVKSGDIKKKKKIAARVNIFYSLETNLCIDVWILILSDICITRGLNRGKQ